uniref:General transcription factor IIF subunit 2 n=1 Tax=Naja naja TaxID=35670 RepID=A0A8C6XAC2_NAJNA
MSEKGELDVTGAKQNTGMWLVKVPKYLSQQWSKALGRGEVGKLRIAKNQGRTEVSFTLNEDLANINDIGGKATSISAPRDHPFLLQNVGGQTLTVFTESSGEKLSLEGIVVQRAECRPAANESYMKLKRLQIEESSKPVSWTMQLDKAVTTNYKPVANHHYNIVYDKKKKEDGKRARAEKQQVLDMLFSAFEKHQYYNIKDLVDITKQPVIYLKEILRDIGIYNFKGPHKSTWELKPEYRHYQNEDKSD